MATQPTRAIEVFYSYSHKDEELRDQLENHLAMLKREGVIQGWHDRRISGGQEWDGEIDLHMKSADIILLLVSSDFLASNYCYDVEVTTAMERHEAREARVVPVILRPCDWNTAPFGKLQALPKDAKPVRKWSDQDEAFLDIAKGIRRVAGEIRTAKETESQTDTPSPKEPPSPTPRLLIPDILRVEFVPRKDQNGDIVARLKEELAPHQQRLIALWGAGGVGKTALAIETARALAEAFAGRIVWVSADGREDFNLSTLLDAVATQLGNDDLRKLALEPKKAQVRELVAVAPTLIVLDNFETIEPEEAKRCVEWLAQPALCSALITTRDIIETGARNIPVKTMLPDEAHKLLRQLIAQAREPKAFARLDLDKLIETAEANPLVLQWIVGQINLSQDPQEVLDDLRHGEGTAAERVFDHSFNLKQLNNGGRAVLLALSLFVPSATRKALAAVSGFSDNDKDKKRFKAAVRNLSALWLIRTAEDSPRLAVEGLTRELTKAHLSADPRNRTFPRRFTARFLKYAEAKANPTPEHLNALEEEKDNILSAMDVASNLNDSLSVMRLSDSIRELLMIHGYWDEAIRRGEQALKAAHNPQDEAAIARFTHNTAIIYQNRGELEEARRLYDKSLEIEKRLGNQSGIANTLHQVAMLAHGQGELDEARRLYNESLEIKKRLSDQSGIASTLHQMAMLAHDQGELDEARRLYNESLDIAKRLSDQSGIASTLHQMATLAHDQGELDEARRLYNEGMVIEKRLSDQRGIAASLHQLGIVCLNEGNIEGAENLLNQSLLILKKLNYKQNIALCLQSIGRVRAAQDLFSEAHDLFNQSLDIALSLRDKFGVASVRRSLGLLAEKENEKAKAVELLREALSGFESLKSHKAEDTRRDLERLEKEVS